RGAGRGTPGTPPRANRSADAGRGRAPGRPAAPPPRAAGTPPAGTGGAAARGDDDDGGGGGGGGRRWGAGRGKSPPRARAPGARAGPRGRSPARGASSSRGAPSPLRAPARPTQPLEPILIPKLRIRLADFPYLHCSNMPEAVHLGDLLRIWVRPGARLTPSPRIFTGQRELTGRRRNRDAFQGAGPSPGRTHSRAPGPSQRKETLPGAPAGFSGIGCVTALGASRRPSPPLRIRGSEPDSLSIG
uniref:Uncharacterized protein n=1 Tax=Geospiza parvula TaxID=87175 RepID=A0A8U8B221_GEOPR